MNLSVSSLARKLLRLEERETRRQKEMITGWWAIANILAHTLTADKDLPPRSEQEANKKTNWAEVKKYRANLERFNFEWGQAKQSPAHLGYFMGYGEIMGELPEDAPFLSYEEHFEQQIEAGKAMQTRMESFLERIEQKGATLEKDEELTQASQTAVGHIPVEQE